MYQEHFQGYNSALFPDTSLNNLEANTTEVPDLPSYWDSLTSGQKSAIVASGSAAGVIIILILLKTFGDWIGYSALRHHKNVAGVSVIQRSDSDELRTTNTPLGADLPPTYNEALHWETLHFDNEGTPNFPHNEENTNGSPPSYWSSAVNVT